jgi:hypothetical protein
MTAVDPMKVDLPNHGTIPIGTISFTVDHQIFTLNELGHATVEFWLIGHAVQKIDL